jgi:hypothetical protein
MRKLGKMGFGLVLLGVVALLSPVFSPFELANRQQVALGWARGR